MNNIYYLQINLQKGNEANEQNESLLMKSSFV